LKVAAAGVADYRFGTCDAARHTADHVRAARLIGYPSRGHLRVGHEDQLVCELVTFLTSRD